MIAITRKISPALARCELSHIARTPIDVDRAVAQHAAYVAALRSLGCAVTELDAEPDLPDSVFVEDMAVVLDEVAVLTRPGASSRRGESASVAAALAAHRPLLQIQAPGTLDGGDVLRIGRTLYVGQSDRSNIDAITQLRALLATHGYQVEAVPIHGCLHLKSAVTEVAAGVLLVQPEWVSPAAFADHRLIMIDPTEPHAANALRVGTGLVYPDAFPRTLARLAAAGIRPLRVDVSELQKAEGAVTCCSLVLAPATG